MLWHAHSQTVSWILTMDCVPPPPPKMINLDDPNATPPPPKYGETVWTILESTLSSGLKLSHKRLDLGLKHAVEH